MATPSTGTSRPGIRVGSASEFSLFFRVRPGHENDLREAVRALQDSPGYRPGDYDLPIATIYRIAGKIASNSPTAVQAVKQAVRMGQGEPIEQAIAIMMEAHWRSAVHPDRAEGIGAFNEDREPTFADPDH